MDGSDFGVSTWQVVNLSRSPGVTGEAREVGAIEGAAALPLTRAEMPESDALARRAVSKTSYVHVAAMFVRCRRTSAVRGLRSWTPWLGTVFLP